MPPVGTAIRGRKRRRSSPLRCRRR
jgi:hypothetical protein